MNSSLVPRLSFFTKSLVYSYNYEPRQHALTITLLLCSPIVHRNDLTFDVTGYILVLMNDITTAASGKHVTV